MFIVEGALSQSANLQALHSNIQKQIIQIQHNRIKNPNWQKAPSWLFTSVAENLNSGRQHKSSKWPERDSNPGAPDCESDALNTRPRCRLALHQWNYQFEERKKERKKERTVCKLSTKFSFFNFTNELPLQILPVESSLQLGGHWHRKLPRVLIHVPSTH